jgi:CheY-like chemotaxis protein
MKVLIAEDDPVAQLLLESTLKSLGHDVVAVADGEAAWTALADRSLRVVVSDWRLPKLDGLALCRRIRELRTDYICFILLTQLEASDENLDEAFVAGVDEFLTKPVQPYDLKQRLHVAARILGFTTELRRLESIIPICGYCRKVRDDKKFWQDIESYMVSRSGSRFSHGVCPDCYDRILIPELEKLGITDAPKFEDAQ